MVNVVRGVRRLSRPETRREAARAYFGVAIASLRRLLNNLLRPSGYELVNSQRLADFHLYAYDSYEQYREIQTRHNKRKVERVWADEGTLSRMCEELRKAMPDKRHLKGICHGTRNGFEQRFLADYAGFDVIGTEISDTAERFDRTVQWDFHDVNDDWVAMFDFVYTNAFDHAYDPLLAVETWLNQLSADGVLAIEITDANDPSASSEVDPFGVRPTALPFMLCNWFGHDVSIRCVKGVKSNNGLEVWLFLIRKSRLTVKAQRDPERGD